MASMPGAFHSLRYHLIFSTKGRKGWLDPAIRPRVHDYLGGVIRGEKGTPLAIGGVADHVHVLFGWRTDEAISTLVRKLKANSSKWIHATFPELRTFSWQEGYAIFTVSPSQLARVQTYIENQETHHRARSFRDELAEFLKAHQVAFEDRYLD